MFKRICAISLALVIAVLCFTGCHKKGETVVTIDGYDVPSGLYLAVQFESFNTFYADVNSLAGSVTASNVDGYLKYSIDGKSSTDYIYEKTIETLRNYVAVERLFAEEGLELDEDDNNLIDSYTAYYWTNYGYQDIYQINGVSKDSFRLLMENNIKKNKIFEHYYMPADEETGKGGKFVVSDDEVKAYMAEHYILANTFTSDTSTLIKDTEEGTEDTATEATATTDVSTVKERVELLNGYATRINNGESFDTIATEYQTATGETISSGNSGSIDTTGTIYPTNAAVYTDEDSDTTTFEMLAETKAKEGFEYGKAYVTDDTEFLYSVSLSIIYDITKDPVYIEGYRSTVISSMKADEFDDLLKTKGEAFELKENKGMISYYSPHNIKLSAGK